MVRYDEHPSRPNFGRYGLLDEIQANRKRSKRSTTSQASRQPVPSVDHSPGYRNATSRAPYTGLANKQKSNVPQRTPYRYERQNRGHDSRGSVTTSSSGSGSVPSNSIPLYRNETSFRPRSRSYQTPSRPPTPPITPSASSSSSSRRSPLHERPAQARHESPSQKFRSPSPINQHRGREASQLAPTEQYQPPTSERLRSHARVKKNGAWKLGAFAALALTTYVIFKKRYNRKNDARPDRRGSTNEEDLEDEYLRIWAHGNRTPYIIEDPLLRTRSPRPYSAPNPDDDDDDSESLDLHPSSASVASFADTPILIPTPNPYENAARPVSRGPRAYNPDDYVPRTHSQFVTSRERSSSTDGESVAGSSATHTSRALVKHNHTHAIATTSATPLITCIVCDNDLSFRHAPTARCNPTCNVCTTCMSRWLGTQIESGDWRNVRCPNCSSTLTPVDVKRFASKSAYARYTTLANRANLSAIPSFRWCLAPECSSGQIHHGGKDAPIFTCIECGHKSCVVHNRPWHEGETCKQFNRRTDGRKKIREEQASMRVVGQTTKICPGKGCGWRMQKISGCDHMTCSMCKHEFCWLCMADYKKIRTNGNGIHMEDCPHHSNNVI